MKRWTQFACAAMLALSVSACSGDRAPEANNNATAREGGTGTAGTAGTSGSANKPAGSERTDGDAAFVQEQLAMGQAEIELGQMAVQRGSHPEVKRFGQMMVRDHRTAGEELKQIASSTNANRMSGDADTMKEAHGDHAETREELSKLSGREFDRRYIDQMIEDHEKAISDVETRSERADTPVRQWAAKTLPKMRQHLEQAKKVQDTLKNGGDQNRQK